MFGGRGAAACNQARELRDIFWLASVDLTQHAWAPASTQVTYDIHILRIIVEFSKNIIHDLIYASDSERLCRDC